MEGIANVCNRPRYNFNFEILSIPDYNSGPESVSSVQGYETAVVRDYSSGSLSSFTDVDVDVADCGDSVYFNSDNEDTYFVGEYDVTSIVSSRKSSTASSDLNIDQEGILLLVENETDLEFWADSSNCENSSSDDPDITDGDKWQCQHCKNVNWPTVRYCEKCWKLRKNWLPQQRRRPPKRLRRKRSKEELTFNIKRRRLNQLRRRTDTISSNDEFGMPSKHSIESLLGGRLAADAAHKVEAPDIAWSLQTQFTPKSNEDAPVVTPSTIDRPPQQRIAGSSSETGGKHVAGKSNEDDTFVTQSTQKIPGPPLETGVNRIDTLSEEKVAESPLEIGGTQVTSYSNDDASLSQCTIDTPSQEPGPPLEIGEMRVSSKSNEDLSIVSQSTVDTLSQEQIAAGSPSEIDEPLTPDSGLSFCQSQDVASPGPGVVSVPGDPILCLLCVSRRRNAFIVHGSCCHEMLTCYKCAQRLYQRGDPCPYCRRNIKQVLRVIESS